MKNAEWMMKNGYKFSDVHYCFSISYNAVNFYLNGEIIGNASGKSYLEAFTKWLDTERKEPILDDAEKQYLSAVIRPFRDKVRSISKVVEDIAEDHTDCHLFIHFTDASNDMSFPSFREGEMYDGMERNKRYTLKELGL